MVVSWTIIAERRMEGVMDLGYVFKERLIRRNADLWSERKRKEW